MWWSRYIRILPRLWNPGKTSLEVQNRDTSGPTKRTHVLEKIYLKSLRWLKLSKIVFTVNQMQRLGREIPASLLEYLPRGKKSIWYNSFLNLTWNHYVQSLLRQWEFCTYIGCHSGAFHYVINFNNCYRAYLCSSDNTDEWKAAFVISVIIGNTH